MLRIHYQKRVSIRQQRRLLLLSTDSSQGDTYPETDPVYQSHGGKIPCHDDVSVEEWRQVKEA